ncbi:MAG TPA: toprim domain-containing protein [Microlunatus sp.]
MNLGQTLEEVLVSGQGIERPFRCSQHDDRLASASVNVLKQVWYCHACGAKGKVDDKRAPSVEALLALMNPEKAARHYPDAYLELFNWPGKKYWDSRLAPWVTHLLDMGQDPLTGDATFPVYTPAGVLAGVGRRHVTEDKSTRYLYPRDWSAASSLFGARDYPNHPVICLVEGAADAASVWEVGAPAFGVYGSGLHVPQVALTSRFNARVILLGFDMDNAGELAVSRAFVQLKGMAEIKRVRWPKNDPADCTPGQRWAALRRAVALTDYGEQVLPLWRQRVAWGMDRHKRFVEESAWQRT